MEDNQLARSRIYQQRSRARKQSLLADLQRRVAEYERAGVQASMAMQAAAQRVDQENSALRAENARLMAENATLRAENSALKAENSVLRGENSTLSQALRHEQEHTYTLHQETAQPKSRPTHYELLQKVPQKDAGLETECDVAADILVGLHADTGGSADRDQDRDRLRMAMGCTGQGPCSVRNTRVFELMDSV